MYSAHPYKRLNSNKKYFNHKKTIAFFSESCREMNFRIINHSGSTAMETDVDNIMSEDGDWIVNQENSSVTLCKIFVNFETDIYF